MIYLDNAATTIFKPMQVKNAMMAAMDHCASPGRGGHKPAMQAAKTVYRARETVAEFFGMSQAERVVFTQNATHALNIAIKSVLCKGGHAVISGFEHNSVVRPLEAMQGQGVSYTVAQSRLFDKIDMMAQIKECVTADTTCLVINHVSNVFGSIAPLEEIDDFCSENNLVLIVDCSQSAGLLAIDATKYKSAKFFCMPGHKSLYGPQGTGVLLCRDDFDLHSLLQGGTGSNSIEVAQPDFLPDIFESGTMNVPAIAGLAEGVEHVRRTGLRAIAEHSAELAKIFVNQMPENAHVFYGGANQIGLVSFSAETPSEAIAEKLGEQNICVRSGLHCSPLAHKSAGTLPDGTVRVSFSCFNTKMDAQKAATAIKKILTK